jgi:hypothetical protein
MWNLSHDEPQGTVAEVRVSAVGATRIMSVSGYAWTVQPGYPASATLLPPSTGPENRSMITVGVHPSYASGAQQIDIEWRGDDKRRRVLCRKRLDVACTGYASTGRSDDESALRRVKPLPNPVNVRCRGLDASIWDVGVLDTTEGIATPPSRSSNTGATSII